MIGQVLGDRLRRLGAGPTDRRTMVDLVALGMTVMAWRNSPVEDWHSRISQAEMMRANAATCRLMRDILRERESSTDSNGLFDQVNGALANPGRYLPDGRTVLAVAGDRREFDRFAGHVRACTGWWTALAGRFGLAQVEVMLACVGLGFCQEWWLAQDWSVRVERFLDRLTHPELWGDVRMVDRVRSVTPPADLPDEDELRSILLAGPDRLSATTAEYCLAVGLGDPALVVRLIDRWDFWDLALLLEPETPAEERQKVLQTLTDRRDGPVGS